MSRRPHPGAAPRSSLRPRNQRDTICALATPPGLGAIAVVRVSGPRTLAVLDRLVSGTRPSRQKSHTVRLGWFLDSRSRPIDQVLLTVYRAPRSYTGEEMAEISCHGGTVPAARITDSLVAAGCRRATPGEFTRRAVLAGKLTLAQAEALLELVSAQTPAALESALARYRGGLAAFTQRICTQLEDILAAIEYRLSFEDTESDFVPPHSGRLQRIIRSLDRELARAERSRFLSEGARVCIIGRPNAGKSSLFNRLLEKRRALVSPVRGTTRDRVDATLVLGSVPVRLEDTAGLGARPSDRLSRLAESETLSAVREADLTLAVFDRSAPEGLADRRVLHACDPRSTFIILNKTDLAARLRLVPQAPRPRLQAPNKRRSSATAVWGSGPQAPGSHLAACILPLAPSFAISCLSGSGIPRLRSAIARFVRPASGLALVSGERQLSALRACRDSLAASLQAPTTETAALEIRHALDMLSQVDTRVANEAVLDRIFARFCIGK